MAHGESNGTWVRKQGDLRPVPSSNQAVIGGGFEGWRPGPGAGYGRGARNQGRAAISAAECEVTGWRLAPGAGVGGKGVVARFSDLVLICS